MVERSPSQCYMNSSGSRVVLWAWGSAGSISYWLSYYSADNIALHLKYLRCPHSMALAHLLSNTILSKPP